MTKANTLPVKTEKRMAIELRIMMAVVLTFMYALILSCMFPGSPMAESTPGLAKMWSNATPDLVWGLRIGTSVVFICCTIHIWRKIVFSK